MEFLSYIFIQKAIIVGSMIAILCAILGNILVLRRLSLIGDGLSHVTLGGVAMGLLFGVYPIFFAIPIVVLSSLVIHIFIKKTKVNSDAAIGIVSAAGISTGVIFTSIAGGFNVDILSFLFGSILTIKDSEIYLSIVLTLTVLFFVFSFYKEIFSITFDYDFATVSGINVNKINMAFNILVAVTVVLAMKVVGIMLTSALLILPSVISFQIARSFLQSMIIASLVSVFSVFIGVFLAYFFNLPPGATIVMTNFIIFIFVAFGKGLYLKFIL